MTFEEQIKLLNTPPDVDLITPPDQFVKAPYLSGEVVTHFLNEIFGPTGWGYTLLQWPELEPLQGGQSGVYRCHGRVWFDFDEHDRIERAVPGLCAVRPARGATLDDVGFQLMRMGYQGCITDMIKNAASSLGVRLGLGLNDQLLRRKLRLGMGPERKSPAEDHEEIHGKAGASKAGNSGNGAANSWITDARKRKSFWAGAHAKDLTNEFVHEALGVQSLKDYHGSISDAWKAIHLFAAVQREGDEEPEGAFAPRQEEIPF